MKLLFLLAFLLLSAPATAAPLFSVTAINLDGVSGINDKGQIVGIVNTDKKHQAQAGKYTDFQDVALWQAGKITIVGSLAGKPDCTPTAINNRGEVVGSGDQPLHFPGDGGWSDIKLFRWRKGRFSRLSDSGEVLGLNTWGQAVGFRVWPDGEYGFVAWHGKTREIRNPLTKDFCQVTSINDSGIMVGVIWTHFGSPKWIGSAHERHFAYLWPLTGKPYCIETVPHVVFSEALGINNAGEVIGYLHFKDDWFPGQQGQHTQYNDHAFVWKQGKTTLLDRNQPDVFDTRPVAINAAGETIGSADFLVKNAATHLGHPFLYRNGALSDLNSLIPPNSGWELQTVSGLNNHCQIIGSGTCHGKPRLFLLTPKV